MIKADRHQRAHLARLAAVQARMQGMSDRALERHVVISQALREEQDALYPGHWSSPNEHWRTPEQRTAWFNTPQGKAWLHWNYGVSGALVKEIVEGQRELQARAAEQRDTGILRNAPQRSVLG